MQHLHPLVIVCTLIATVAGCCAYIQREVDRYEYPLGSKDSRHATAITATHLMLMADPGYVEPVPEPAEQGDHYLAFCESDQAI